MNKEFEYRGYKFNIKVEFDVKVEHDTKYHRITINDMGYGSYYKKEEVNNKVLLIAIQEAEKNAKLYVDDKEDSISSIKKSLIELGFK